MTTAPVPNTPAASASWYADPVEAAMVRTRHPAPPVPESGTTLYGLAALSEGELRDSLAVHEAGHAVVMLACGMPFRFMEISADLGRGPNGTGAAARICAIVDRPVSFEDFVVVAAAGERAQDRWMRERGLWNPVRAWVVERLAQHDREQAAEMVRQATGQAMTWGESTLSYGDYAVIQAGTDAVLYRLWPQVTALAEAFGASGYLTYEQAAQITGFATVGAGVPA